MKALSMPPEPEGDASHLEIAILHPHPQPVDEAALRRLMTVILQQEGMASGEVSVLLCNDPTMVALNKAYRGSAEPTDVLAFPQIASGSVEGSDPTPAGLDRCFLSGETCLLGDIVVSLDTAARQAVAYGWSLQEEVTLLVLHGLLHLLGYRDEQEPERQIMQAMEEHYFQALVGRSIPRQPPT